MGPLDNMLFYNTPLSLDITNLNTDSKIKAHNKPFHEKIKELKLKHEGCIAPGINIFETHSSLPDTIFYG